ncbi:MAG: amidase [Cyanobacteria bacterium P01_F01_bin.13]
MTLPQSSLNSLTVQTIADHLTTGKLSIAEFLQVCLQRVELREPQVSAWTYLDIDHAKKQAAKWEQVLKEISGQDPQPPNSGRSASAQSSRGFESYPLLGIPVAVKDIFATLEMPTCWGTEIYQNRYLDHEAAVVSYLKSAGAIILGKTVTTALATATAGSTTNPHNMAHTPGGSSSGSAAAVADGMVPLAIGSQTMGSVLRPAAYCGVFGFKPSFGLISRYGMMPVSQALDHVGMFSRCLDDIQRLLTVLVQPDSRDPDCQTFEQIVSFEQPFPGKLKNGGQSLRLGLIKTSHWSHAEDIAQSRLLQAVDILRQADITIDLVSLPSEFDRYWNIVQKLCAYGLHQNHGTLLTEHPDQCSPLLESWLKRGQSISDDAYQKACQERDRYRKLLASIFDQYDAVITPVTTGPAPLGLGNTGSPIFCGLWTLCGLPALNIPLGYAANGLPLGCQLVGTLYSDRQLLAIAEHCWQRLKKTFGDIQIPTDVE